MYLNINSEDIVPSIPERHPVIIEHLPSISQSGIGYGIGRVVRMKTPSATRMENKWYLEPVDRGTNILDQFSGDRTTNGTSMEFINDYDANKEGRIFTFLGIYDLEAPYLTTKGWKSEGPLDRVAILTEKEDIIKG